METKLIFYMMSGIVITALMVAGIIMIFYWLHKIRKIKKNIPQEMKGGGKDGYKFEEKEIKEYLDKKQEFIDRNYARTENSTNKLSILPSSDTQRYKSNTKRHWPSFE